ncbi:MAG: bifunctional phosphoribosylaminoimidazolecarboxamide formyltransferase/IMP cyclohydrolase [Candidatus Kerfeldbacteria bacterium]|nr:bifunctional phosphoribosylaminoimidazolecarboxamide formyltransferase/IMP cyclohydrolase [Candidatus Kerfeldbacteria bacterium]
MIQRALVSVSDKTGLTSFVQQLVALGIEIISTGGTAKTLTAAGIPVRSIDDLTGFPEMMDGRVKTLHPKVHGGILAVRDNPEHMAAAQQHTIAMIDLVVVNLYPFETKPSIANIDIGGPAMVRSAAKNFKYVGVVVDPNDYQAVIQDLHTEHKLTDKTRHYLMQKAFAHTAYYDSMIADYMNTNRQFTEQLSFGYRKVADLRYGENPHQAAAWYRQPFIQETSLATADIIQGKQLSYNNIMDGDAALRLVAKFTEPACAIIKHTNPCGTAVANTITTAFERAYAADPQSAFGGIVALNRTCTLAIAEALTKIFVELVIAPDFEPAAITEFSKKAKVRILAVGPIQPTQASWHIRQVSGGLLVQQADTQLLTDQTLRTVTTAQPSPAQLRDLQFAWIVCQHVKSNAIVLAKNGVTLGVGAGQMSRIDSTNIALTKAGDQAVGAVVASDAFFPFRDSIDQLAQAGLAAIIQPGGSIKDAEVIAAANEHNLAMVFTGQRAFLH